MIKNLKFELGILATLLLGIFIFYNLDLGLYLYFKEFNDSLNKVYLKKFFYNITDLGDSFGYFLICLLLITVVFMLRKTRAKFSLNLETTKNILYFTFFSLLLTGIVTQIIKHVIGRPRPNHTDIENVFSFNFFTLESSFHSFPSGHTSTIFILTIIFSALIPNLKYFFYTLGFVIAFSRVVVGAHFLTDVIGGIVVAAMCYKIMNLIYSAKIKKINVLNNNSLYCFLLASFLILTLLTIAPSFDLFLSGLFYKGKQQFVLQSYFTITILIRDILLPILLVYLLILPVASKFVPIKKIYFKYDFLTADLFFIWSVFAFNAVAIHLLKTFWGRGRPGDILQLGGKEHFSPWYKISDACSTNCSFVSGDAAVGFALVLLFFVSKNLKFLYLSIVLGCLLGIVRIAEGGHFLSDIVCSGIIVFSLSLMFKTVFRSKFGD